MTLPPPIPTGDGQPLPRDPMVRPPNPDPMTRRVLRDPTARCATCGHHRVHHVQDPAADYRHPCTHPTRCECGGFTDTWDHLRP